jgi:hypothetical protein
MLRVRAQSEFSVRSVLACVGWNSTPLSTEAIPPLALSPENNRYVGHMRRGESGSGAYMGG